MKDRFDVIVVGAGHAGSEAAAAAANLGSSTLLITMDMFTIAKMSCNPAIGGIAKGQIVREIDALGGYTGIVTDQTSIQFRMLNRSKGPAMWSPRAQSDRVKFSVKWREALEKTPNLSFWQDTVNELIIEKDTIKGVKTKMGMSFYATSVILTNGTFLNGLMHVGETKIKGGRDSENASYGLSEQLLKYKIPVLRMKTGTPPRLDGRTINFDALKEQEGDEVIGKIQLFTRHQKPADTEKLLYRLHQ
jgi:tRNA uridine 5-carboxymethylaminomethyl modification enzyme